MEGKRVTIDLAEYKQLLIDRLFKEYLVANSTNDTLRKVLDNPMLTKEIEEINNKEYFNGW